MEMCCKECASHGECLYFCAPAQEEKEMQFECRCKKCDCGFMSDRNNSKLCGTCGTERTAELRQLHRDAALAALSGFCARPFWEAVEGGQRQQLNPHEEAIRTADEFVRQYNPDAVIAEVVG